MPLRTTFAFLALAVAAAAGADTLIVRNVRGYTPTRTGMVSFSTLVVTDGRVSAVLRGEAESRSGATVVDGGGRALLPGLIDAHGHVLGLGQQSLQVDLRGSSTLQEALERVRKFAAAHPGSGWIVGRGWNQVLWPGRRFPTARELDAVLADRPALLTRVDGHAIWVNRAALRSAGISARTPDPAGGQIVRDTAGEPTGVFIDTATALIERHVPAPTDEESKRALRAALRELAALGITTVHDAGIDMRQYRLYEQLGESGELPIRVYAMLADSEEARQVIPSGPRPPRFDDRLLMRSVKAWADGALGSRGAALLEDYTDQPGHRGLTLYTAQQLQALAALTAEHGWQLNVHAIGDAGNRMVIDTFEKWLTGGQRHVLRPRIEHAQVLAVEDIARVAKLELIASIQPTHATSDMNMAEDRVGPARIQGAYAWRKLLNAGARLAGGSDFPVELANPFHGLYAAVTRQDSNGHPAGGWYAGEQLSREEALRSFTADAAHAGHMEQMTGSLEPGKWADFVLIDRDYFRIPAGEIDDIEVLATYVAGREVK